MIGTLNLGYYLVVELNYLFVVEFFFIFSVFSAVK